MPYNVARDVGGDSPQNTALMERCVQHVMASGKPKQNAIAICKSAIQASKRRKGSA